jgi:hypothetical protein
LGRFNGAGIWRFGHGDETQAEPQNLCQILIKRGIIYQSKFGPARSGKEEITASATELRDEDCTFGNCSTAIPPRQFHIIASPLNFSPLAVTHY